MKPNTLSLLLLLVYPFLVLATGKPAMPEDMDDVEEIELDVAKMKDMPGFKIVEQPSDDPGATGDGNQKLKGRKKASNTKHSRKGR